jgi:hypothetical protein
LLVFLSLSGFPPHLALLGVLSLITSYSLFTNRVWATWLVFIMLITISVFSLYALSAVGFSNATVTLIMIAYTALTWTVAAWLWLRRKD